MSANMSNVESRLDLVKRRLNFIMSHEFTINELEELVVMSGIASSFEVDVIQHVAIEILERSLTESDLIDLYIRWNDALDNGVDCTIEDLRSRFKVLGE